LGRTAERQARGSDGLAMPFVLLAGRVERNARGQLWELGLEHLARALQDEVASGA
jgi:hypothetical protein